MVFDRPSVMACVVATLSTHQALGYTPESPQVKAMVERAVRYLESNPQTSRRWDPMLGTQSLMAYATFKHRQDPTHPLVRKAIQRCEASLREPANQKTVYEIGVAISLLTQIGDAESLEIAAKLYQRLLALQKPNGSFAYAGEGDTSVTQYAILAMWAAKNGGVLDHWSEGPLERAANWLLRTQAPAGNWAYHGADPGAYRRIRQTHEPSPTMWAAGAGSLYISADALGLRPTTRGPSAASPFIPVEPVEADTHAVDPDYFLQSLALADKYGQRLPLETEWQYYYLYAMERYHSLRSALHGDPAAGAEARWYDAGVELLTRTQRDNGSFQSKETNCPPSVDTSLAVLFLLRSTKDQAPTSGIAVTGKGIPLGFRDAVLAEDGAVIAPNAGQSIEGALALIGATDEPTQDLDWSQFLQTRELAPAQLNRVQEQVRDAKYEVRLAAVRVLSTQGLDGVPDLIHALSDPDDRITIQARNGLRRISRKLGGFGLPRDPSTEQKRLAQRNWRHWLQSVRPDVAFSP